MFSEMNNAISPKGLNEQCDFRPGREFTFFHWWRDYADGKHSNSGASPTRYENAYPILDMSGAGGPDGQAYGVNGDYSGGSYAIRIDAAPSTTSGSYLGDNFYGFNYWGGGLSMPLQL